MPCLHTLWRRSQAGTVWTAAPHLGTRPHTSRRDCRCVCVCVCARARVCGSHVCVCMAAHVCLPVWVYSCVCVLMSVCVCVQGYVGPMCVCVCVCVYAHEVMTQRHLRQAMLAAYQLLCNAGPRTYLCLRQRPRTIETAGGQLSTDRRRLCSNLSATRLPVCRHTRPSIRTGRHWDILSHILSHILPHTQPHIEESRLIVWPSVCSVSCSFV